MAKPVRKQVDTAYLDSLRRSLAENERRLAESGGGSRMVSDSDGGTVWVADPLEQEINNLRAQIATEDHRVQQAAQGRTADGFFIRPEWESMIDDNGNLLDEYKLGKNYQEIQLNTDAMGRLRQDAMRDAGTDSQWGQLMLQKAAQEKANQISKQGAQMNAGLRAAYDEAGQLNGSSRERIARMGMRDAIRGRQDIRANTSNQMLNVRTQDEQNRLKALQGYQSMEMDKANYLRGNEEAKLRIEESNIRNAMGEVNARRNADLDEWKKNQEVIAADKQAAAQQRSSGGGNSCCFIFLEARYGDGTMDAVVRRFRDEHMTARNKRGYYKLSEVLVPLMRKSSVVKFFTRALLTDPLVAYGKYHYGENKWGVIFKPLKNFWLKTFDYLGQDHEFVRENGEIV